MSKKPSKPSASKPAALQTIDPTKLGNVSGGTTRVASTSADDALYDSLNQISQSLSNLAQGQNNGGMNMNEMMLLIMMMGSRNQPTVVTTAQPAAGAYPGYPGYPGGWPWGY